MKNKKNLPSLQEWLKMDHRMKYPEGGITKETMTDFLKWVYNVND